MIYANIIFLTLKYLLMSTNKLLTLLFLILLPTQSLFSQTCSPTLNGAKNYSSFGCATTLTALTVNDIGKDEQFTFDVNLTVNGNATLNFEGNGSNIIIASGVTVTVTGDLNFNGNGAPKDFIVNGTLIVRGNMNAQNNITYKGNGQITVVGTWQNNGPNSICASPCNLTFNVNNCLQPDNPICQAAFAPPLPITLLGFEVSYREDKLLFVWQTLLEEDNSFFTIEASQDGQNYSALATEEGAGNHIGLLSYQKEVEFEEQGLYYFRLKQTDIDGKFSYSQTLALEINYSLSNLKVYRDMNVPNSIYIKGNRGNQNINITVNDVLGRKLYSGIISSSNSNTESQQEIRLEQNASPFYIIRLTQGNEFKSIKI
jgi:hypothetical protein